ATPPQHLGGTQRRAGQPPYMKPAVAAARWAASNRSLAFFADLLPYSGGRSAKTRGRGGGVRNPPKIPGNPQVVPLYFHMRTRRYSCQPRADAGKAAEGRSGKVEAGRGGQEQHVVQEL